LLDVPRSTFYFELNGRIGANSYSNAIGKIRKYLCIGVERERSRTTVFMASHTPPHQDRRDILMPSCPNARDREERLAVGTERLFGNELVARKCEGNNEGDQASDFSARHTQRSTAKSVPRSRERGAPPEAVRCKEL
jgi:hypothetical protein